MSVIKKSIFFIFCAAGLCIMHNFIATSLYAADATEASEEGIQVRIFTESKFDSTVKDARGYLHVYGLRVKQDGSEKVEWKRVLREWSALPEVPSSYEYLYLNGYVYLYFDKDYFTSDEVNLGKDNGVVFQLNRDTGVIVNELRASFPEVSELRKNYRWTNNAVTYRSDLEEVGSPYYITR